MLLTGLFSLLNDSTQDQPLLHQPLRKYSMGFPQVQSPRGIFSVKISFSRMTVTCVKLTKTQPAQWGWEPLSRFLTEHSLFSVAGPAYSSSSHAHRRTLLV